jgi:hypothetical protein
MICFETMFSRPCCVHQRDRRVGGANGHREDNRCDLHAEQPRDRIRLHARGRDSHVYCIA